MVHLPAQSRVVALAKRGSISALIEQSEPRSREVTQHDSITHFDPGVEVVGPIAMAWWADREDHGMRAARALEQPA